MTRERLLRARAAPPRRPRPAPREEPIPGEILALQSKVEEVHADPALVEELLVTLSSLPIAEFVKDVVMEQDLPGYGLAPPSRQFSWAL